jgi:uncharacterized protein YndB with AHSA1/START domain
MQRRHDAHTDSVLPFGAMTAKSNEIAITRIYDAPVQKVWDAWVVPEQVAEWWGPRGFTITTKQKDVRAGGTWTYTMHGPDGVNYENKTVFLDVIEGSLMVYDHGGNDERPPLFRVKVRFSPVGTKTKMEMHMIFSSPEVAEQSHRMIKKASGHSTWDRLSEYLDETLQQKDRFVINRSFGCPALTLYDLWTDPKRVAAWLPSPGATIAFSSAEIKPGGSAFYKMTNADGTVMHGSMHYIELTKPHRLVYTQMFRTEAGEVARHPLAPLWPESMRTVVEFAEEGPNESRVTITWEPQGAKPEEVAVFKAARGGMTQGWTGSLDNLEAYLDAT